VTLWRISAGFAGFCFFAEAFFAALFAAAVGFDFFIRCTQCPEDCYLRRKNKKRTFWRASQIQESL
jgi:hypothetical protein